MKTSHKKNPSRQKGEKQSDDDSRKRGRNRVTKGEVAAMRADQGSGHS